MKRSQYFSYMRSLANANNQLNASVNNSYYRININEFLDAQTTLIGDGPLILVEEPSITFLADSDNPIQQTRCAFMILIQIDLNDYNDEDGKMDLTRNLCEDFLSHFINDFNADWAGGDSVPNTIFRLQTVSIDRIDYTGTNYAGHRCAFTLQSDIDLSYHSAKWTAI